MRKPIFGVRHKPGYTARGLKFRIKEVEGLYYLCSENKGADGEADLRLCFRICKKPVFSRRGSYAKSRFSHDAAHMQKAGFLKTRLNV